MAPSRRNDKDERRDNKRSGESSRRRADRDGDDRRFDVVQADWGSKSSRRSVASQSALVSRDGSHAKRARYDAETSRDGGSSAGGARRSSRSTMLNASSSRRSQDLGRRVTYTRSPSPMRTASDSRHRFAVVASGSQPKDAPPAMVALNPEEKLNGLDTVEHSSNDESSATQVESPDIPEASVDIESLPNAVAAGSGSSHARDGNKDMTEQPQDDDHLDQLPLSERARQLKGKGVVPPASEQPEKSTAVIPPVEPAEMEKVAEKGALPLLEKMRKLKEKIASYISTLVSDGPRFVASSVRSVEDEPTDLPSLVLPMGSWEERLAALNIRAELKFLQDFLQETPFDGVEAVKMLKTFMGAWAKKYPSPIPADLEALTTRMGALAQRLEHGSTFEETTLNNDEADVRSHLQRLDAACSEVVAAFAPIEGGRAELVDNSRRATSMKEKQASKVAEYEKMLVEYQEKVKEYERKTADARKREEELRRMKGFALENLDAFDKDVKSQGESIGRLTRLRDELKDHAVQVAEERKRLQARTPGDVAAILAYPVKPPAEEAKE